MMGPLNLLVIEDSDLDFHLVRRHLQHHEVEARLERVDNPLALTRALAQGGWDAVLSDHNVPGMDFRENLEAIKRHSPELPVILVSGSIGEEEAIELLHRGLSDFVLKDRPARLAEALRKALEAGGVRRAKRAAEAALLESEARFSTIFRASPLGIGLSRLRDGVLVEVNEALLTLFGNKREEVIGRTSLELRHWADPEQRARLMEEIERRGRIRNFEIRGRRVSGEVRDLIFSGDLIDLGGEQFVLGMLSDITPLKEAERSLRASEARFQTIFKASPLGILLTRASDGTILDANPAFLDLIELSAEEALGKTTLELQIWASLAEREAFRLQAMEGGGIRGQDVIIRTCTGKQRIVALSADPVDLGGEWAILNLVEDLSERRKAEEERRLLEAEVAHAQKLDSLGALAGGVSHDMNNVLGAIMAVSSLTLETHKDDPILSKTMETLLHAAERGRDLVKGLTDFARKDIPEPRRLDLNEVVQKEAGLLHRTTLQKVSVELDLQRNLPPIQGDPSSISNALMNLCVNALDAMPTGGRLTLSTRTGRGGEVALSVRDTGQGMPPEVVERALEPFFTTKPAGKGTGLGLALVYGVMKAHGGRVDIQSQVGRGTEILLSFPPLEGRVERAYPAEAPTSGVQVRALQILLVDDDELIRLTIPAMVQALGHGVEAVCGGLEALQHLESGARPDLVILDLSMPGLDGEETLERLRAVRPELPVLLATGFRDERHARILDRFTGVEVIQKPFSLTDLRGKLSQMR